MTRRRMGNEAKKSYKQRHIEQGLCIRCPMPAQLGRKQCMTCAAKTRASVEAYRKRHEKSGICRVCTVPAKKGSVFCPKHLEHHTYMSWKRAGTFGTRRHETRNNGQMTCIVELKMSPILHPHWKEVEPWIMEHIDIFVDPTDQALRHSTDIAAFEDRI